MTNGQKRLWRVVGSGLWLMALGALVSCSANAKKKATPSTTAVNQRDSADESSEHAQGMVVENDSSNITGTSVTASEGESVAGFFWVGSAGYWASSAEKQYCVATSMEHWLALGGPASGSAGVPNYAVVPSYYQYTGSCRLPNGFFWKGAGGYAAVDGHFCAFISWEHWLAAGGPANGSLAVTNYPQIPDSMQDDGECRIPPGLFWMGPSGYYANDKGHFCSFPTWSAWLAAHGPANGALGVTNYAHIPNSMISDGVCP